jgi:hypothetical protein
MITDNDFLLEVYLDSVFPVGEQFFRLALISIRIQQYRLPYRLLARYMIVFRTLLYMFTIIIGLIGTIFVRSSQFYPHFPKKFY